MLFHLLDAAEGTTGGGPRLSRAHTASRLESRPVTAPVRITPWWVRPTPFRHGAALERPYRISTATATPLPPPRHDEAMPRFSPRRRNAYSSVVSTLAPLAPIGWPSATAPPWTFTRSGSIPSSRSTATSCTENASLISIRSTCFRSHPTFCATLRTASTRSEE